MKTVFITGLSREMGLGIALAKWSLNNGYKVFGSCRNIDKPHISQLAKDWEGVFIPVAMDVASLDSVKEALSVIGDSQIDVLVSNATATNGAGNKPLDDGCDTEHMLNAYDVNAVGFLRMVQTFLPKFSPGAVLAAITSESGSMRKCFRDGNLDYGMAKAALNFACVTLQRRFDGKFRVLAVHPGWVQTHPAPPKADLSPDESAAHIMSTIENPPEYVKSENKGVFVWYDGRQFEF